MRTRHQPVAALVLVVILAAPVLAGPVGGEHGTLAFAPVPDPRTQVARSQDHVRRDWTEPARTVTVPPLRTARPVVRQPVRTGVASQLRTEPPVHREGSGSHRTGTASWYCGHGSRCTNGHSGGLYAAAGPQLRVGNWRGRYVVVQAGVRRVRVQLIDCNCGPHANLIDLYSDAFQHLAPLSRGVLKVTVTW
jgi:hypothetical protein